MIDANWDIVIIGAGPAGALAACLLARKAKVLLVDKASFPRAKVCGCCINTSAIELLRANSIDSIIKDFGAIPLTQLKLFQDAKTAHVALSGSVALSRERLDSELVNESVSRGATFLPSTAAEVIDTAFGARKVKLGCGQLVAAKLVIAADGLNGRALRNFREFDPVISDSSRFGCGTTIETEDSFFQAGVIYMACANEGYVGAVRLEDGRLDIAAAFDKDFSRAQGNSANAVADVFTRNNISVPDEIFHAHWMGTDRLTRTRKQLAAERILVIGDACGYAEPFTGEGIAWAMASAEAVVPLALAGSESWDESLIISWQNAHSKLIQAKQKRSVFIAKGLRSNTIRKLAMPLIATFPMAAKSIVNHISNQNPRTNLCRQES